MSERTCRSSQRTGVNWVIKHTHAYELHQIKVIVKFLFHKAKVANSIPSCVIEREKLQAGISFTSKIHESNYDSDDMTGSSSRVFVLDHHSHFCYAVAPWHELPIPAVHPKQ